MNARIALRAASVLAVLLAGSCTGPDMRPDLTQDPELNHPISIEPSYRALKLTNSEAVSREDSIKLAEFASDYLSRGNGAITIAAPAGPEAPKVIAAIGEELVDQGVPRSRILVGEKDRTDTDGRVEIGFVRYEAHTAPCGDWTRDAAHNADNDASPNFGCAVEQNIAAQVADPRDFVQSRGFAPSDSTRRMQVIGKYEQGQVTSSQKTPAQSAAVSDVGASAGSQ